MENDEHMNLLVLSLYEVTPKFSIFKWRKKTSLCQHAFGVKIKVTYHLITLEKELKSIKYLKQETKKIYIT